MKKQLLLLLYIITGVLNANAQLKEPTNTSADTLIVVQCFFDGTKVDPNDWPVEYFFETPKNIVVSGQEYIKNKHTDAGLHEYDDSWKGHVHYYIWKNATVNGKQTSISRTASTQDCEDYPVVKYNIGNYTFYVIKLYDVNLSLQKKIDTYNTKPKKLSKETREIYRMMIEDLNNGSFQDKLKWYQLAAIQLSTGREKK